MLYLGGFQTYIISYSSSVFFAQMILFLLYVQIVHIYQLCLGEGTIRRVKESDGR